MICETLVWTLRMCWDETMLLQDSTTAADVEG